MAAPSLGYLWYALRDPHILPQTVFWMSNGGRHASPWSGVNRCLGVEDGCAYFASGLRESVRRNELNSAGIPTSLKLRPGMRTEIAHIQGVVRVPRSFDAVRSIEFRKDGLAIRSLSGNMVKAAVRWQFLFDGEPSRG